MLLGYRAFPIGGDQAPIDLVPADAGRFLQAAQAAGLSLVGPRGAGRYGMVIWVSAQDYLKAAALGAS